MGTALAGYVNIRKQSRLDSILARVQSILVGLR